MTLLRFSGVGREFGARWVVRGVSFHIAAGERWGIVGRNGAGKTTLLRLITDDDTPTEGEIWRHPGIRFTLLRQNRGEQSGTTVQEAALEPFAELLEMERQIERESLALAQAEAGTDAADRLLHDYDRHLEEFRRRGGYEMRSRAEATLEGLGFAPDSWEKQIRSLSGGELGRLRLVQTLLAEPDVLLLDEPTNHLDLRSTEWLEEYLRAYRGTVLVVSHDRVFLERLADHVLHIEDETAVPYTGGYQSFLVQREERRLQQQRDWEKQQEHISRTEEFIRRNLAGQKTKQAKSRRTLLGRMERVERPSDDGQAMALRFGNASRSGGTVLRLDRVTYGYGKRTLFAPFSVEATRGERIAIVGPNGCGKSTLMRVLAGHLQAPSGEVVRGTGVKVAYYRQDFTHLDGTNKVWEEVARAAPTLPMAALRDHLARFLFPGDDIEARVGDLSGGEQARVALAKITLERANLLLLDEPTNHLDIPSREALEEALSTFDGTLIVISHDRALLSSLATRIWGFTDDGDRAGAVIDDFAGGFDEWMERRARKPAARDQSGPGAAVSASPSRQSGPPVGISKNELRRRQQEAARLEQRITELEESISKTERLLADPALYAAAADPERVRTLAAERDDAQAELARLYEQWERAGEELAGV
jgi:ATP-binding cassette subfamily F protein 3